MSSIAAFVSPHGFGHAARMAAILSAVQKREPDTVINLFTTVPQWFFSDSGLQVSEYHPENTDVGLVQENALRIDLVRTVTELGRIYPVTTEQTSRIAALLSGCDLVLSDISPLGLVVAKSAGIKSVLVENFTWDQIYSEYQEVCPEIAPYVVYFREIFNNANCRIQVEPCLPYTGDCLRVGPVSRSIRASDSEIRTKLQLAIDCRMVLVTMGGVAWNFDSLTKFFNQEQYQFVVPGLYEKYSRQNNVTLLPHRSEFYHPDLVNAADVVVGKLGYSTVAEVYQSGTRFIRVMRSGFCESPILASFCDLRIPGVTISEESFESMSWIEQLPKVLEIARNPQASISGAEQAAKHILKLLA